MIYAACKEESLEAMKMRRMVMMMVIMVLGIVRGKFVKIKMHFDEKEKNV